MPRPIRLLAAASCFAYPVLCHAAVVLADARWAAAGIAFLGWAALSFRLNLAASLAAGVSLFALAIAIATIAPQAVLYAPPAALNLALCTIFASTLHHGREPMITRFARVERGGDLPVELARYTRFLTVLWTAFFAVMAAISLSLAVWASAAAWSLFTNLVNYLLVVALFVGEYVYRRIRYRQYRHATPGELIRRLHTYRIFRTPRPHA